MFQIETAGLVIRIENRYEDVRNLCIDYITDEERKPDLIISASEEEIRREMEKQPELFFGDAYGEEVVVYEEISNALPPFDAFVMHSSVVEVNGGAYAFAAESGTGKSTHTKYWEKALGDRLTVINGDKPIFRFIDDKLMAYGTPWCGKEGWQTNKAAPMKALCLLERSKKNEIFPVDAVQHLGELMRHFHLPAGGCVDRVKLMGLIDRMIKVVPVFRLRCRNDISAAEMAIQYFGL